MSFQAWSYYLLHKVPSEKELAKIGSHLLAIEEFGEGSQGRFQFAHLWPYSSHFLYFLSCIMTLFSLPCKKIPQNFPKKLQNVPSRRRYFMTRRLPLKTEVASLYFNTRRIQESQTSAIKQNLCLRSILTSTSFHLIDWWKSRVGLLDLRLFRVVNLIGISHLYPQITSFSFSTFLARILGILIGKTSRSGCKCQAVFGELAAYNLYWQVWGQEAIREDRRGQVGRVFYWNFSLNEERNTSYELCSWSCWEKWSYIG